MEWSREVARILLALTVVLLPLGSVASAGSKEDVSAATSEWGRVLAKMIPTRCCRSTPMTHDCKQKSGSHR